MKQYSVALRAFDTKNMSFDNFTPVPSGNGLRSRISYKYDDGTRGPLILRVDRVGFPFGIQKAKEKKQRADKSVYFVEGKEWQLVVGNRGIRRSLDDERKFEGADKNTTLLFEVADQIDIRCEEWCLAYGKSMAVRGVPKHIGYKFVVRSSETVDPSNPKPENQLLRMKLTQRQDDEGAVTTTFRHVRRENGRVSIVPFDDVVKASYGAEGVIFVCVASIFITNQNQATVQWRVNQVDVVQMGTDPNGLQIPVFDASGVDYGFDVNTDALSSLAPVERDSEHDELAGSPASMSSKRARYNTEQTESADGDKDDTLGAEDNSEGDNEEDAKEGSTGDGAHDASEGGTGAEDEDEYAYRSTDFFEKKKKKKKTH